MKKKLKIYFEDFWGHDVYLFNPNDNYFLDLLSLEYDVTIDPSPDILFYSVFGGNNNNYNGKCKKVFFLGENTGSNFKHPDTQFCDLSMSQFDTSETNMFFPLWALQINWSNKTQPRPLPSNPYYHINTEALTTAPSFNKTKFCAFINGNPTNNRLEFFNKLSKYKQVDSYGPFLNNVGGLFVRNEHDKINLLTHYKFTIAFENTFQDGYNTEKIIQPLAANCMPIYWGGKKYKDYFNTNKIICLNEESNNYDEVIEQIIALDNDQGRYNSIMQQPSINYDTVQEFAPVNVLNRLKHTLNI